MLLRQDRRDFLRLAGLAGVTFTAGLFPGRQASAQAGADFHFVQFSDTHWGYSGAANPDAEHTLEKAVATVNGLAKQPDFIVFTGPDIRLTIQKAAPRADEALPRDRLALSVKDVRFMPESATFARQGRGHKDFFSAPITRSTGAYLHRPRQRLRSRRCWATAARLLAADLKRKTDDHRRADASAIVRPEAGLGLTTADGAKAIDLLMPYSNVVVLYGHKPEGHHMTGHIAHHAASR
jgi:3',5'-cyclic AMP phosphodiesterase CpdA